MQDTSIPDTTKNDYKAAMAQYQSLAGSTLKFTPGPGKRPAVVAYTSPRGLRVVETPWATSPFMVRFPKAAGTLAGRRYYQSLEDAKTAISSYENGKTAASLGKRAMDEYLYVTGLLGSTSLTEAVRFYLEHKDTFTDVSLEKLKTHWLSTIASRTDTYQRDCKLALSLIEKSIKSDAKVSTLTKAVLASTVRKQNTYWNRRRVAVAFASMFACGVRDGLIARNPMEGFRLNEAPPSKEITYLKPEEARRLLTYVQEHYPEYIAAFALQFFAGIRTEELSRAEENGKRPLYWSDLSIGKSIFVPAVVSKTNTPRLIELWPTELSRWLPRIPAEDGPVMPFTTFVNLKSKIVSRFQKAQDRANLPRIGWGQNVIRHTYGTYLVALFQSAGRAAKFMGHRGEDMLANHYFNPRVTQADAEDFFGMTQEEALNPPKGVTLSLTA